MKKLIIFCVVVGLLSITNYAVANPTYTEAVDLNQQLDAFPGNDPVGGGPGPLTHTYTHTYDGSVDPLVYGTLIGSATLTIDANGVNPEGGYPADGEQDPVKLSLDGGGTWIPLGNLQQWQAPDDASTIIETEFNLADYIDLVTDLEGGATLTLEVGVENGWEFKLHSSELVIVSAIPAPGAILLGSLGVGLVGWLRRRRTL